MAAPNAEAELRTWRPGRPHSVSATTVDRFRATGSDGSGQIHARNSGLGWSEETAVAGRADQGEALEVGDDGGGEGLEVRVGPGIPGVGAGYR